MALDLNFQRRFLATALLFLGFTSSVAGCAPAQRPPASEHEKDAAIRAYMHCLLTNAAQLDDGKSDAQTVALAIEPMCAEAFQADVRTFGRGMNAEAYRMFAREVEDRQIQTATAAVLRERAIRSQGH